MSAVGNLEYFKSNNIYSGFNVSDMTIKELIDNYNILPKNSLIVSSPQNAAGRDNQQPGLIVTDAVGQVLPLTYSFNKEHFVYNNRNNTVSISMSYFNKLSNNISVLSRRIESLETNYRNIVKTLNDLSGNINKLTYYNTSYYNTSYYKTLH